MINHNTTALVFISFLLMSCSSTQSVNRVYITYEPVGSAYQYYDRSTEEKRVPLMFDNSAKAETCTEYFQLKNNYEMVENEANFLAAQSYVVCDTILAIKQADQNFNLELATTNVGNVLAEKLDISSFRSSLAKKATENSYTLNALSSVPVEITDYAAISETHEWYFELKVVARIDANADGAEDWLIWVTDKAKTGSYSTIEAYIAYDAINNDRLTLNKL
jgi:hypothetical protein